MTRIKDVIILGRGVPEQISNGRITVCVAGYSETAGFIRLYPTRIDSPLAVWNIVSVEVERNPLDNRNESWKLPESRAGWEHINQYITINGELKRSHRIGLLDAIKTDCVKDINAKRQSLGIIQPSIRRAYLGTNKRNMEAYQPLFEMIEHANVPTKRDFEVEPRFEYSCGSRCKAKRHHDMQLLDWGCYQWIRKNPQQAQQIWSNMGIGSPDWMHYFLVGNQANQRTSFMVVNVLRQKCAAFQPTLLQMAA
jgi:hypothetical protein